MQRALSLLGVLAIAVVLFTGCEPAISEEELGHVIFETPKVEKTEDAGEPEHQQATSAETETEPAASGDHSHSDNTR